MRHKRGCVGAATHWTDHLLHAAEVRVMHGKGVRTFASGSKHDGEWKEGKQHGKGACAFKDE